MKYMKDRPIKIGKNKKIEKVTANITATNTQTHLILCTDSPFPKGTMSHIYQDFKKTSLSFAIESFIPSDWKKEKRKKEIYPF